MCSGSRKGPAEEDEGMVAFTSSLVPPLSPCLTCLGSGEVGFGSLLLSCGAHFCKSLKSFSAEVPKAGSECVHWILMAIKKTQWWD